MRFFASALDAHYKRHLAPIVEELLSRGHVLDEGAEWVLTAGRLDAYRLSRRGRKPILVEHGAGQTYLLNGVRVDASGMRPDPGVRLYLGPNRQIVGFMRSQLPEAECVVVGSPALEHLAATMKQERSLVVFAVHWHSGLRVPEAGTSWPWSLPIARTLHEAFGDRFRVHAHPRIFGRVVSQISRARFAPIFEADWDLLAPDCRVLVCDNSSIIWEAATMGIRVVLVDAPGWGERHGLRFGPEADQFFHVDSADRIVAAVEGCETPTDPGVYELIEGATSLAADVVERVL